MSEIADFLRARIAEWRALAEAASPGPWHANAEHDEVLAVDDITVAEGFALSGRQLRATVEHIAANDPEAVIADLDAKLALLDEHAQASLPNGVDLDECRVCGGMNEAWPCPTLRILAQPFAPHPHHKGEEWAP